MPAKTMEVIIGQKTSGPADETKVLKSEIFLPQSEESQVESYHHRGGGGAGAAGAFFAGVVTGALLAGTVGVVCPYCGVVCQVAIPQGETRLVSCARCGNTFSVSR